jgi:hypothetical protein
VLCGVVGGVSYDGVSESGFPVCGRFEACRGPLYGDVKVVQGMVFFCFNCKL